VDPATTAAITQAVNEAFLSAFRVVMLVGAALALASSVVAALLIEGPGFAALAQRARSLRGASSQRPAAQSR
jgi:hypothetical protein